MKRGTTSIREDIGRASHRRIPRGGGEILHLGDATDLCNEASEPRLPRYPGAMTAPGKRTHCPQGHPYDRENTARVWQNGGMVRKCRICRRNQGREAARRRRAREKKEK